MVMALGLPAIQRVTLQKVNSTTRKFIGLIRTVRNDSILLNRVHRLVINFEKKQWWVEEQTQFKLLTDASTEPPPKAKKGSKADPPPPSNFAMADKFSKEPMPMPSGVEFSGVLKEREGLVKEGMVYIHFFPNGFNDQAILYLNREGSEVVSYSMLLRPNSGRVELYREAVKSFEVSQ